MMAAAGRLPAATLESKHDGSYNDEMLVHSFHRQRIVHSDNAVYALGDILRSVFFVDTIDRSGQLHPAYEGLHADR